MPDIPALGPGYLAKFGPIDASRVFWVDPQTGLRVSGDEQRARANVIAVMLEIERRYPVADGACNTGELREQYAANEKARRDVTARIVAQA